jgi:hypothetical protein
VYHTRKKAGRVAGVWWHVEMMVGKFLVQGGIDVLAFDGKSDTHEVKFGGEG